MRYPEEEWKQAVPLITKTVFHPKPDHLVVLLYHENHFAIMEINFLEKQISIYNGLDCTGANLHQWHKDITFVLMTCGEISVDSKGE